MKKGPKPKPIAERFWTKVKKTEGCWIWIGALNEDGYGKLSRGPGLDWDRTHRISWEIHFGPIPGDSHVLHTCDNRACVRPDHLFSGDQVANVRDMLQKGRGVNLKGSAHGRAKLTEEDVRLIRRLRPEWSAKRLAEKFNVSPAAIYFAASGKNWAHLK